MAAESKGHRQRAMNTEKALWIRELQSDDTSVQISAIEGWRTFLQSSNDESAFFPLQRRLSDKKLEVREKTVAALGEIAEEVPDLASKSIAALAEPSSYDSESLILEKMRVAKKIFVAPFIEWQFPQIDPKLDAFYRIAELGFSNEWSERCRLGAMDMLDTVANKPVEYYEEGSARGLTAPYQELTAGYFLKGMEIAIKGFNDESLDLRFTVKEFLKRGFERGVLSDIQAFQFILPEVRKGVSSSNQAIRKESANFLIETIEFYPSLKPEASTLLKQLLRRRGISHGVKVSITNALSRLAKIQDDSPSQIREDSSCENSVASD